MNGRFSSVSSLLASAFALVACSSSPDAEPPPSDPLVYDASAETRAAVGIAKWGWATDAQDGASVFHGYGARNELLVEIRQSLVQPDDDLFVKHFALTMSGPLASGSERIDFVAQWHDDTQSVDYAHTVIENTFAKGSTAARVLERLAPDAAAIPAPGATAGGSLVESVAPRDDRASLVGKPGELLVCCQELSNASAALSASASSACSLVTSDDDPTAAQGGGGDLAPKALVLGADGKPVVKSPWVGPYNIVDNHCHNAAAANSSPTDGYIGCVSSSSTTSTSGHTINWAPDPSKPGTAGAFCAYEPQSNGGSAATGSVCCWQGSAGANGAPLFDSQGAQDCVKQLCLGQATFAPGILSKLITPPTAYPAGSKPLVANDCPSSTDSASACAACCTKTGNDVWWLFFWHKEDRQQVADYQKRCATACTDRDLLRQQQQQQQQQQQRSASNMCLSSALAAKGATSDAKQTCPKK